MAGSRDIPRDYARALLSDIGADARLPPSPACEHPAVTWAKSGAMALTGRRGEAPRVCPAPLAACAEGALLALTALAGRDAPSALTGARMLGERTAIAGYARNGGISPGGSCRFLRTADGWIALNLARDSDWDLIPVLTGRDIPRDWNSTAQEIRGHGRRHLLELGRELGLAIADRDEPAADRPWFSIAGGSARSEGGRSPIVVDLSALWAGPLCGHLLQRLGARVIKVESIGRPDGARGGPPEFYDLLNQGKESVALDFSSPMGRNRLRRLIARADIVIEASRPRALEQLGISADAMAAERPGLVWLSITGHGRTEPEANWIAFGDDAAVSAGLSAVLGEEPEGPIFCGDAIGDPLAGLHAAVIVWHRWKTGQGGIVSVPLRDVVRHCIEFDRQIGRAHV